MTKWNKNMNFKEFFKLIGVPVVLVFLLLFFAYPLFAISADTEKNSEIIIISSGSSASQEIVNTIRREITLNRKSEKIKVLSLKDVELKPDSRLLDNKRLVIPVGTKAIDYSIKTKIKSPFIASFTTKSAFSALTVKAGSQSILRKYFVGGVALDQPPQRLTSLAHLIKPDLKTIGVVLGPNSRSKKSSIQRQTARIGARLNIVNIGVNDNPVKILRSVFRKSELFIVVPDKANFNRSLARWVVALSYKQQVPVISYSKKYSDAGALVSLYSKPHQIGKQTAEIALSFLNRGIRTRKMLVPKYFDLSVNASVKKAFHLSFPSKIELLRSLYKVDKVIP